MFLRELKGEPINNPKYCWLFLPVLYPPAQPLYTASPQAPPLLASQVLSPLLTLSSSPALNNISTWPLQLWPSPFLFLFWMQKGTIYYFICSTNRCFLSVYHALGTVLCTRDMAVNKTDRHITCPQGTHIVNFFSFWLIFIRILLIYNVVLVSAVQQSKSVICIHISNHF